MKKTTTLLSLLAITTIGFAQSPRMTLFEEFTGENCGPCASTNPVIDPFLATHQNIDCITLKWQVAIPSAPSSLTSLYQQNKVEIDARDAFYGIISAPSGRIDGQSPTIFGAGNDHAGYIDQPGILSSATAITSPFTIAMTRAWDATFSTLTVTVALTATGNYTTTGTNLKFRLVMTEKEITYATAPGSNGEKEFHWVARKSYPTLAAGTAMANTWTTGQTQTFTVSCVLPAYIWDKSQVEMVGFIQDDANKKVLQAGLAAAAPITNDALAYGFNGVDAVICGTTLNPVAIVTNNGSNAITTMTINPFLNTTAQAPFFFNGTIAAGATATIALNPVTGLTGGVNSFSVNIVQVNGAADNNLANNTKKQSFSVVSNYVPAPIVQTYTSPIFPGTGWILVNTDGGAATKTWQRTTAAGGFGGTPAGCAKYNFYSNGNLGDKDELFMPAMTFTGLTAPMLTFDVAKAAYFEAGMSAPLNDQLEVLISTDCGANWTAVYSKDDAGGLTTAPTASVAFTPIASQWRAESINLTAYANSSEVLVKFVATSDYGNNLYVDNINLSETTTSIKSVDANFSSVELFPNPTSSETSLQITLINQSTVTINVLNTVGQVVYQSVSSLNAGTNAINIDTRNFAAGIYNVVIASQDGSITKKLSVTK